MSDAKLAHQVATRYMVRTGKVKTAGEVRFIKDNGPEGRAFPRDFEFKAKAKKPLAKVLWSVSCALGHTASAYTKFTKVKAVDVSPDGKLGGKGYIQDITKMRSDLNTALETLSRIQDTLNDELRGPHWSPDYLRDHDEQDEAEVEEMLSDSEEITSDPEGYVEKEYQEEVVEDVE
jgi:hypothetical protein